ncbi:MAG TPA: PLP-dependent aminotransferase family protein [Thermodesulfobacteriota bacterium]
MVEFAKGARQAEGSVVREILKVTARPEVISLAGGLPAPELFPTDALARAAARVFERDGAPALQYSTTEGHPALREWIAAQFARRGAPARADEVVVTAGSQQGLDLAARLFLEPGALAAVEEPGYLAAIQAFRLAGADLAGVPVDAGGIDLDALDALCRRRRVRLVYTVSEFQNPTGVTLAAERRARLVELADRHGFVVVDDNPYGALRYEGAFPPAVAAGRTAGQTALEGPGRVVSLGSFSKVLAPGLRLGYVMAAGPILERLVFVKQAADLHTTSLGQRLAADFLASEDLDAHLGRLRREYARRRDALLAALPDALPVGSTWTRPDGGMFVWVTLPPGWDAMALFHAAVAADVAFVPGAPFYIDQSRPEAARTLRLNFSNSTPERIDEGLRRLRAAVQRVAPAR